MYFSTIRPQHNLPPSNQNSRDSKENRLGPDLVGLVADEGNNHAVQVEEEHDKVETKLDERFLLFSGCVSVYAEVLATASKLEPKIQVFPLVFSYAKGLGFGLESWYSLVAKPPRYVNGPSCACLES